MCTGTSKIYFPTVTKVSINMRAGQCKLSCPNLRDLTLHTGDNNGVSVEAPLLTNLELLDTTRLNQFYVSQTSSLKRLRLNTYDKVQAPLQTAQLESLYIASLDSLPLNDYTSLKYLELTTWYIK